MAGRGLFGFTAGVKPVTAPLLDVIVCWLCGVAVALLWRVVMCWLLRLICFCVLIASQADAYMR